MSIVTSSYSKERALFAIGGAHGRIKVYDVVSKASRAEDSEVHSAEIISILWVDQKSLMISSSKDR